MSWFQVTVMAASLDTVDWCRIDAFAWVEPMLLQQLLAGSHVTAIIDKLCQPPRSLLFILLGIKPVGHSEACLPHCRTLQSMTRRLTLLNIAPLETANASLSLSSS